MRIKALSFATLGLMLHVATLNAQNLFTFGEHSVDKKEFLRIYQKNAINQKPDMSEKALREYLDLYALFRMKVQEAEALKLDTMSSINSELVKYRKQIARTYLTDEEIKNKLVKEAYDRSKEMLNVSHILIAVPRGGIEKDSMDAFRKVDSLHKAISAKQITFEEAARLYSDDKATSESNGLLGNITALQTIYDFENAAYALKKGQMSSPVRTPFGYHIIRLNDRQLVKGELRVAQILIKKAISKEDEAANATKIAEIKAALKKGTSFESLVKKYSEDKFSINSDGILDPFGPGQMVPEFENVAYALKKVGDVSEPVTTEYGVHFIKLVEVIPFKSFDQIKAGLSKKVESDPRSLFAREVFLNRIKKEYNYHADAEAWEAVLAYFDKAAKEKPMPEDMYGTEAMRQFDKTLVRIGDRTFLQSDFITYFLNNTRSQITYPDKEMLSALYKNYTENIVTDYQEYRLEKDNAEFANLMRDYREGIMLFELMDQKVWSAAPKDSVGLEKYYNQHKEKYKFGPGFRADEYRFDSEENLNKALALFKKGVTNKDTILNAINTPEKPWLAQVTSGYIEFEKTKKYEKSQLRKGSLTPVMNNEDGSFTVAYVHDVFNEPQQKSLKEAKGFVVSEYQEQLEKDWNAYLKNKYPVKVNEAVLRSMIAK